MREPLTIEDHDTIWSMHENGEIWVAIGEAVGRSSPTVRRIVNKSGGKRPAEPVVWSAVMNEWRKMKELRAAKGGASAVQL